MTYNPFALSQLNNSFLKAVIRRISNIDEIERWYDDWLRATTPATRTTASFIQTMLGHIGVNSQIINEHVLNNVPVTGPFIFVANHPLGGIDGLILIQLLSQYRPDIKVLTNEILCDIPELKDIFIGVDVLNSDRASYNAKPMRTAARCLANDNALLVFPAGTVSTMQLPSMKISDAPWSTMVSRLARKFKAPVMPIFIEGRNSTVFYLSAFIHKRLRTLLLPRAITKASGTNVRLHIGQPVLVSEIERLHDDETATLFLRLCCKIMDPKPLEKNASLNPKTMETIRTDVNCEKLLEDLSAIDEFRLFEQGSFSVYCAPFAAMGTVMSQLSIDRERTFRLVEEGTGKAVDLDQFDPYYCHLFLWDKDNNKIAGGYRIGKTDAIIRACSIKGLYSHSLFEYSAEFLTNLGHSIEVGRSFITPEYQKNLKALDMLWKGIGRYVANEPAYHTLFGCVSISRQYSDVASALLTQTFLYHYGVEHSIASKVKARVPLKSIHTPWTPEQIAHLNELPILNSLVGRIDPGKSVPVLIRHYLALKGRFVSFTVNNGFNDSIDGLIMVDLRNTPERYIKRYLGDDGLNAFKQHHNLKNLPQAPNAASGE